MADMSLTSLTLLPVGEKYIARYLQVLCGRKVLKKHQNRE